MSTVEQISNELLTESISYVRGLFNQRGYEHLRQQMVFVKACHIVKRRKAGRTLRVHRKLMDLQIQARLKAEQEQTDNG